MILHSVDPYFYDILSKSIPLLNLDISLSERAIINMVKHMELLIKWGYKFNLTSIKDPTRIVVAHFLDSLTVFNVWRSNSGTHFLDLGTGAGFPGLVVKTASENIKLTLLDKNPRKILFLKIVSKELGLSDISFTNTTFQNYFAQSPRTFFDVICFRALPKKIKPMIHPEKILNTGGSIIQMYSEVHTAVRDDFPGFKEVERWSGNLPFFDFKRTLIRLERI
jgi:16S rRNA (guanine527-N7)-methyltransferase